MEPLFTIHKLKYRKVSPDDSNALLLALGKKDYKRRKPLSWVKGCFIPQFYRPWLVLGSSVLLAILSFQFLGYCSLWLMKLLIVKYIKIWYVLAEEWAVGCVLWTKQIHTHKNTFHTVFPLLYSSDILSNILHLELVQ